jgi:ring-1,2-phenylacetyl-CoA epoxidase subunit PaaD
MTGKHLTEQAVWHLLEGVPDPEVPVLSVLDLGVVRHVNVEHTAAGDTVRVTITPTYTGCPAMDTIASDIRSMLTAEGVEQVDIRMQLTPPWTTDWLSEAGKRKLEAYGIAPPVEPSGDVNALFGEPLVVPCPQCKSTHTVLVSQFGSTACKALYKCNDCLEPFDHFKCLKPPAPRVAHSTP